MKYKIERSAKPAYLQIYEQLRADIVNGIYGYCSKIPSKRLLAEETGISVITIEHAYALLQEEGYIEAKERSGYFVSYRDTDSFASGCGKRGMRNVVREAFDVTHDFPFSVMAKIIRKTLSDYGEGIFAKSPNGGCFDLRFALSQYLERSRGVHAAPTQIFIGSGAEYLYGLIVDMLGRDLVYATERPSYEKIEQVYRACGVTCETLPLGSEGIESDYLIKTEASVLHITPYRSYPSGVTASASKRREYIYWAKQGKRFIVEDDFESEFTLSSKPEETLFSLSNDDNIIYLNTFSKTISPSLRIAYMVLPLSLVPLYEQKVGFYSCTVPTFEQCVLTQLIQGGDFERHINRIRRAKRRQMGKV